MHVVPGLSHAGMIASSEQALPAVVMQAFGQLAKRRLDGEPMAYLLGQREFYGRLFVTRPAVLIPRPETEHLVEAALAHLTDGEPAAVLDLGTGSGAVAVTLALEAPALTVTAIDLSADALAVARQNAESLGASVRFLQGSWFSPLGRDERYQLIVSNPPYIAADDHHLGEGDVRFEPRLALTDEADGLSCLRLIVQSAPRYLVTGGWLLVEHGYDQGVAVRALFAGRGFLQVETLVDLAGCDRLTVGRQSAVAVG